MKRPFKCLILSMMLIFSSCVSSFNCVKWANDFKNQKQVDIIVHKIDQNGSLIYLTGKNTTSGKLVEFYDGSGQFSLIINKISVGDTVIKVKGKYNIIIKGKSGQVILPVKCDGKIFKDIN